MNETQATVLVKLETQYNASGFTRMWISFEGRNEIVIRIRERFIPKQAESFDTFEEAVLFLLSVISLEKK